jgi:hypothetical protein
MAMGTGAKIAIGCGCILLLGAAAVVGVVGVGAWWAKDKLSDATGGLEKIAAATQEIERWEKKANANPFTEPPDGVVQEARLKTFLDVRKDVFAVYERHKPEFDSLGERTKGKQELSLSETIEAGGQIARLVGDIRLTEAKSLAGHGMSQKEYRYIQVAVYKSAWASEASTSEGKLPAEAVSESMSEAAKQMQDAMRAGLEAAQKQGVPGSGSVSDEDVQKLQEQVTKLGEGAGEVLEVPRANVELFRKYEADIKKYAMHGLAFIGL